MSDTPRDEFDDEFDDDFDEGVEEEPSGSEVSDAGEIPTRPMRAGSRARGAAGSMPTGAPSRTAGAGSTGGGGAGREGEIHVTDRASRVFVIGSVVVFVLILLNGMILGAGGAVTPIPSATPVVTAAPTVAPSASARASASASTGPSASPAASR